MTLQATEAECAAVAVAPRVSLADIEAAIAFRYDVNGWKAAETTAQNGTVAGDMMSAQQLGLLSICLVVLKNGFTVIGKSAPASPENFNADLGRKLAYEDAVRQIWPLMGFALRDRLHRGV